MCVILYNTCETGHIESSVLLSLSASCCKIASATGYRVYRPGTSYTALYSLPDPTGYRVFRQADSKHLQHGFNRLVTESADRLPATRPALKSCFTLASYRAFLPITNQHQESRNPQVFLPAGHSSSAAYSPAQH